MIPRAVAERIKSEPMYDEQDKLYVLMWAIEEDWQNTTYADAQMDWLAKHIANISGSPAFDMAYNIASLRGRPPQRQQEYKTMLRKHLPKAITLLHSTQEEPEMTEEQGKQIIEKLDQILAQLGPSPAGAKPTDPNWPSLGVNSKGEQLTLRDAIGRLIHKLG